MICAGAGTASRLAALGARTAAGACAGAQVEEQLAPSVVTVLSQAIADQPVPADYANRAEFRPWLERDVAAPRGQDRRRAHARASSSRTVHYEATRAGLDPQLVLGVIQHESAFHKYAVSAAGARGYMQVMPFWIKLIGSGDDHNLFHLRTNLRYGCVILRHYLDIENGDLYRALGRYNGSLGRPEYPTGVLTAMQPQLAVRRRLRRSSAPVLSPTSAR